MLDETEKDELRKRMRSLTIIWVSALCALGLYVAFCHFNGEVIKSNTSSPHLKYIFFGVACLQIIGAPFIRTAMLKKRPVDFELAESQQTPSEIVSRSFAKYLPAVIVSLVISESIAIYGVILFFLGHGFDPLYQLTIVSAFAMWVYRPKLLEFELVATTLKRKWW